MYAYICAHVQVLRGHKHENGLLSDYCDGSVYKSHPLFSLSSCLSLELLVYYDDVEVCNPLGSRAKKHKLGMDMHMHHPATFTIYIVRALLPVSRKPAVFCFSNVLLHAGERFSQIPINPSMYSVIGHCQVKCSSAVWT